MKRIPITRGLFALVDDADYPRVAKHKWFYNNGYAGTYISELDPETRRFTRKYVSMHRFILDPPRTMVVDHVDFNRLNNQRHNLRIVTKGVNTLHSLRRSDTTGIIKSNTKKGTPVYMVYIGRRFIKQTMDMELAKKYRAEAVDNFMKNSID